MSTTVETEVYGVRDLLGDPLPQAPSYRQILSELEAEYQNLTNQANLVANDWMIGEYTVTTVAGQRDYAISVPNSDFFRAITVTTVPATDSDPQYPLEFSEIDDIPKDWGWLGQNKGQYMSSSHDSQILAIYRKMTDTGEAVHLELRPTPTRAQDYNVLYQVTDWWNRAMAAVPTAFMMPHSSQRVYLRCLVAMNLLGSGKVKWSYSDERNVEKGKYAYAALEARIARYKPVYDEYIENLESFDIVEIESWADGVGL